MNPQIERVVKIEGPARCRRAFHETVHIYQLSKFAAPIGSSAPHDISYRAAYRRWSPHTAHCVIDTERAVERLLGKSGLELFLHWFGVSDELPSRFDNKELEAIYRRFVIHAGAAFIERGLWPLRGWFRMRELEAA